MASQSRHSLVSSVAQGLHIDLGRPEQALNRILTEAARRPFVAVTGTDDATVVLASRAAAALGLAHNPPEAALISRRKDHARARLAAAGLPVPWHRRIDLSHSLEPQLEDAPYPCVVKPLAMSASRGVIRADDPQALAAACRRSAAIAAEADDAEERSHLLLEQFLPGPEVTLEGMLADGTLEVLAIFDKPEPLNGPYFEETYYVTPSRHGAETQKRIAHRVEEACRAYGLRQGPVHAELRLHGREAWIMEVASRTIGGECARLLRFAAGHGLEELVLSRSMGQSLPARQSEEAAGVLMIPIPKAGVLRRVEGVLAAGKVPHIEEVAIAVREGYELQPLPEGNSYLGFIFARAPTPAAAEAALRGAHGLLRIVVAPSLRPVLVA